MFYKTQTLAFMAALGSAVAQRPTNTSICDYYTTALLKNNTAENQKTLLTLVVNTAVIGNYTQPNVGIKVPGILAKGEVDGVEVNLAPYFNGGLASTNRGNVARAVNFLDGGGAEPLMKNMAANDTNSMQYMLITHLYEYFGMLLQCSKQGNSAYPAYSGDSSMYETHKFMALDNAEVTYFIQQVGMSAASFGVAEADVTAVGTALSSLFGNRCAPKTTVIPSQGAQLQSICVANDCPLSANDTCSAYAAVVEPKLANGSDAPPEATASGSAGASASGSPSATGSAPVATVSGSAGVINGASFAAVLGGAAMYFL